MQLILYVVIALCLLGGVAAVLGCLRYRRMPEEEPVLNPVDMECCGQHEVCEKESLLAAVSKQIEYYNDEELDRHRGRSSDAYSAEEAEEFREILYTMREEEVAGWVRSLQLRGVELPDEVRDEVLMIVNDRRSR